MSPASRKLFLCLALVVGGCDCDDDGPIDEVVTKVDPGVDFSEFHTFKILDEDSVDFGDAGINLDDIPDDLLVNIDTANDQARIELENLGLTQVDEEDDADLVIFTLATIDEQGGYYWACVPGYWWGYWGPYWDPCAWLEPIYVEYSVGTLVLVLGDPAEQDIPFGGLLQGVADGAGNTEERIRDGVHEMFEDYPEGPPD
jgi:Domain of unknown function (DUF4136)